ncbi:tRNA (uracil-5-)-methyltransferase-like protein A [Trichoplax sp. H2]|nr:tRNA (uracil-5-)-methyltransferase-like protein A [Trichoplax sp. H2]|eukprot:RDD46510.1 tRNA (uracil-5-)-methyltransferase-like protein A [Trichoplax sp. H2]
MAEQAQPISSVDDTCANSQAKEQNQMHSDQEQHDHYSYTKREEFTSEIFKIEIYNLPFYLGFVELKKLLKKLDLQPVKVKLIPRATFAFVTFGSEAERQKALKAIDGYNWKKKVLQAKLAKPVVDPIAKKRNAAGNDGTTGDVDSEQNKKRAKTLNILDVVIPLWDKSYDQQLKIKKNNLDRILRKCTSKLEAIKVPEINNYRNKCEFAIGQDSKDEEGNLSVVPPTDCANVPEEAKAIAKAMQSLIQQSSLPVYSFVDHTGYWRQICVRRNLLGQLMAIVQLHPQNLSEDQLQSLKDEINRCLEKCDCQVVSVYLQKQTTRSSAGNAGSVYEIISGSKYLYEDILGMKFRISPSSFFQGNTLAAEVLYRNIRDWCPTKATTVVLDICCGTGTIGILMAKNVNRVIGIEMVEDAIEDARVNAELNDIKNIEFICGKAEDKLPTLVDNLSVISEVIAIVDPPRAGLHTRVIKALRRSLFIKKLIYVSCNPAMAVTNFVELCSPRTNRLRGQPFKIMKALAVDLFPYTEQCELVLQFER